MPRALVKEVLVSDWVREIRRCAGLTQPAFATIVGVTPTSIHRWETGKTLPHRWIRARLVTLAEQYGVSVAPLWI